MIAIDVLELETAVDFDTISPTIKTQLPKGKLLHLWNLLEGASKTGWASQIETHYKHTGELLSSVNLREYVMENLHWNTSRSEMSMQLQWCPTKEVAKYTLPLFIQQLSEQLDCMVMQCECLYEIEHIDTHSLINSLSDLVNDHLTLALVKLEEVEGEWDEHQWCHIQQAHRNFIQTIYDLFEAMTGYVSQPEFISRPHTVEFVCCPSIAGLITTANKLESKRALQPRTYTPLNRSGEVTLEEIAAISRISRVATASYLKDAHTKVITELEKFETTTKGYDPDMLYTETEAAKYLNIKSITMATALGLRPVMSGLYWEEDLDKMDELLKNIDNTVTNLENEAYIHTIAL